MANKSKVDVYVPKADMGLTKKMRPILVDHYTLLNQLCTSCHVVSGEPTIAPPIVAVVNRIKSAHPERDMFVDYIVN